MQLKQLIYFIEIIQCGSMSEAARRLYISQPSLSQAMRSLEEDLGFPLLIRTSQGILPTEMGKRVYRDSRRLVEKFKLMTNAWSEEYQRGQKLTGTVRIVTVPTAYPFVADCSIPAISELFPRVRCHVMEARRFEIIPYLVQQKTDLGIANVVDHEWEDFMTSARKSGLCVVPLLEDTFQVAVSSSNPLARQEHVSPENLTQVPLVLYSGQDAVATPYYAKYFNPDETLYVNSNEKMVRLVAENQAAAVFPMHITLYCQTSVLRKQIKFLDIDDVCLPITHYLAYRNETPISPEIAQVKEVICSKYAELREKCCGAFH